MSERITKAQLRAQLDYLNYLFGYPREPYAETRDARGGLVTNVGTFTLDCAYGGYRLCQMCEGGGERDLTNRGSARETYDAIRAVIKGAELMRAAMTA
jgi:hypothetical protein